MHTKQFGTVVLAVVVACGLAAGCGSKGGKKGGSRSGSYSSSGGSGSVSGGSSSSGSSSGSNPSATATTSPVGGALTFEHVDRAVTAAYETEVECGTGKWTTVATSKLPSNFRSKVTAKSYDCYAKSADTTPDLPGIATYLQFKTVASAQSYVRDGSALKGVVAYLADEKIVVTIANPTGMLDPRSVLDKANTDCRQCGEVRTL